jgi:hypothetical protein
VLRFGGLSSAPSKARPAWAYRPGKPPLALADWSHLLPASAPQCASNDGYRAIVRSDQNWLKLVQSDSHLDAAEGTTALVRWSSERVCLEAVELPADSFPVPDELLTTRVVAVFGTKPAAARLGLAMGTELRQPLSCTLGAAQ